VKPNQLVWSAFVTVAALSTSGSSATHPLPVAGHLTATTGQEKADLRELRQRGNALFRAGQYLEAATIYESGYQQAIVLGEKGSALRFLNNLGSSRFKMFRYREAIKAYLEARELSVSQGDEETLAAVYSNLSSLYFQLGEMDAARESAKRGLELPEKAGAKFKSKLLIQSALILIRDKDWEHAFSLLDEAVAAAKASHDIASESQSLNELGEAQLEFGRLPAAEQALIEAAHLREQTGDDTVHYTYELLADLRFRQGDMKAARGYYDKAIASGAPFGPSAVWSAFYLRGRAGLADGRLADAYRDFESSIKCLRQSRAEVLPADAFRVGTEVHLHDVYSSFIETGSRLYRQTGQRRYAEQTFAVAEESRAASLRALWAGSDLTKRLPQEYWQTLLDLQRAEVAQIRKQSGAEEAVRRTQVTLNELEVKTGLDMPAYMGDPSPIRSRSLEVARAALAADEVYLGFHMGVGESCVWAIVRDGFEFRALPAHSEYAGAVARFSKAVNEGSPGARTMGRQLYEMLFGSISRRFLDKPVWIVAPDGSLFDLPFAALVEPALSDSPALSGSNDAHYLIELHAVRIVPGVSTLLSTAAPDVQGPFVGIGDPIYNRADDRLRRPRSSGAPRNEIPNGSPGQALELSRLAGSGREVESCAEIWRSHGSRTILLEGAAASGLELTEALRQNVQVLHIATHFLFPSPDSGPGLLALALIPGNQVQLLSATEIATFRSRVGLVVLDGCSSGHAAILPGAGLMGMTRAWMAAGAQAVVATRWPVDDREAGEFFRAFYRLYYLRRAHRRGSVALILQEAQRDQLRSGGLHSDPAYWAAYFCVERN
jgi:CHAT domain-containing protein/tetratricopeptide (TPR) repeat protein